MATIIINNAGDLDQTQFESVEELIEVYFSGLGKVVLEEINPEELPKQIKNDLEHSKALGENELYNYQG